MILISKSEAALIRKLYPDALITRTCIQKSEHHKYYIPEVHKYLILIADSNAQAAEIVNGLKKRS